MRTSAVSLAAALAFSALLPLVAAAEGRLDKIKQAGAIVLGHPESSVPFAYLDDKQAPIGYSVEICQGIAAHVQKSLGLAKLDVRYNPTSSATRIPLLANGTIDLECGNTTNNLERHKLVAFAPTTFVAEVVLTARKDGGVNVDDLASFRGKAIAAQAGGQTFRLVSQLSAKNGYNITVIPTKDTAETFLMVESGRAAGSAQDSGLAYASVASARTSSDFVISKKGLEPAPYGIVQPKDDPAFKKVVDEAVVGMIKSGKVAALYQKYFLSPIPPKQINLNYPMSDILKRVLASPTDSGDPAVYQ
ncbi:amino acid ABC transporter substrate-binding protein [Variovorax arabinosiphilus]|uniref:amino acid ABC transporter substrate-binding protein n=1 Tax=Variovorax arabinosiphilus TaxID=3053498 RepID=UPI0025776CD3|nr:MULTISPECIES: amino acid ABC transporter substrate-binding protein [unclassified Variovorax]MDM0122835.1 amino acid ABC transporter substrate-binding protein [Variovorax sp. J2L1-78]MDM0132169.1 amino acid ABC transporter substrate-binding protein [Variovorax sp. J2L1-63]MDM0235598.1 amino acid ABC transporter substrate-binding protein [Variovorax sp. J2R1-6]